MNLILMADAVGCAKARQQTPNGYYNPERMLRATLRHGEVLARGSCLDARGLTEAELSGAGDRDLVTLEIAAGR